MNPIRIGIIGFGFMGHEHLAMLRTMEQYQVTALCDIDPEQLKDAPEGIATYTNAADLIASADVDVIIISANNNQHKDLVVQGARAGKQMICEKPFALTVADLDEMMEEVNKCGVHITVHQQRRLDPDFRTIKQVYDQGRLGKVFTVQSKLYGFNGNMHDWHIYPEQGGGMLYDWGVHLIDQILWMMPGVKVKSVFADLRNVINKDVDDYFNIMLRMENGVLATIELGTYFLTDKMHDKWFERHWFVGGDQASAYCDGFEPEGKVVTTNGLLQNVAGHRTMTAAGPTRSFGPPPEGKILTQPLELATTNHRQYFENYARAYHGQEDYLVHMDEVRRVLRLMEAVRQSAATGKSVDFE